MTTDEQIIAAVGEPIYQVCKSDSVSLSSAWIDVTKQTYTDAGLYSEYGRRTLYTADAILYAAKPLLEHISELEENAATMKGYYEQVFEDGGKRIAELTKQRDELTDELKTLKGLSHDT